VHHTPLAANVAPAQTLHGWDEARVLDHVRHQVFGIAADGVELETGAADKVGKVVVGCEADAVAVALEGGAQGDERLDIAYSELVLGPGT
jgi:hypothetical protein